MWKHFAAACLTLGLASVEAADLQVYQEPEKFLTEVFGSTPQPRVLWLTKQIQAQATAILGHPAQQLRQRYWADNNKSVWILEDIGKEELITAGFVVMDGRIDHVRVLVYRESRGEEVRYSSFLKQFKGAKLSANKQLDRGIDGISGATLSVWAMERMAKLALYFDEQSRR